MRILVHALGCKVFGSKHVFDSLMKAVPPGIEVTAIAPGPSHTEDIGRPKVRYLRLSHRMFGQLLRPAVEVAVATAARLGPYDGLINLSNYGLCWSLNQVLYFHSPTLLENRSRGFSRGRSNAFKRYCLLSCLRGARRVFVQTEHMRCSILRVCSDWGLEAPPVQVLRPPVRCVTSASSSPRYGFQLFYPASDFAHKRTGLAIEAAGLAAKQTPDVGLVVTAASDGPAPAGVTRVAWMSREEVGGEYGAASALLFTSESETLGLPLLEALDRGLPAVLPDLPYAHEVYGDAAVYFGDPTPDAVSDAILRLRSEIERYRLLASERRREVRRLETSWEDHWSAFLSAMHPNRATGG